MTIAACYVSPEGVVFGADSTTTFPGLNGQSHYYNHAQKLFEVGENSTLGIVTWGLGGLVVDSYRSLIATFADHLSAHPPADGLSVAEQWVGYFSPLYSQAPALQDYFNACRVLAALKPFDPSSNAPSADTRTEEQEHQLVQLIELLTVGFCIGGYVPPSRTPFAYRTTFGPFQISPTPIPLRLPDHAFWGVPNFFRRLVSGCDDDLRDAILRSGQWAGTPADLFALVEAFSLKHPIIPIRDAIDFTHACIYSTIKAMKFSSLPQICGGPIELAVITADRRFRWVRHKKWDAAITDGETHARGED